jgi:hypothetical protein
MMKLVPITCKDKPPPLPERLSLALRCALCAALSSPRFTALLLLLCLASPLARLEAQPNLTFKRAIVSGPDVELYYALGCNGNPDYSATEKDFRIFDNGVEVRDFKLWCPDPTMRCAISVALVFDCSGSMSETARAGAKQAGHAFVDMMDGFIDEGTVVLFDQNVQIYQRMTTDRTLLHTAVDAVYAGGESTVWDGVYDGLNELINTGVNQCRALILVSTGNDVSSTRTSADIISLANRHRIHVYTIGLGSGSNVAELELISMLTGGKFFQTPNPGQLATIYQEISTIMFQGFQECFILYKFDCMDGAVRTVELQLNDYCGGSQSKIKTYRAPLDSSTFTALSMELGSGVGGGGMDLTIPLRLLTPIDSGMLYPFQFTLEYDTAGVELMNAATPPATLLAGVPVTWAPATTGATIFVPTRALIDGSGTLMELHFRTKSPADTTCCEIRAVDASFEQGCFTPHIASGQICIYPDTPILSCGTEGPSELRWDRGINDYVPGPFPITAQFFNAGDTEALNPTFKITYDTAAVKLVSPLTDVQIGATGSLAPITSSSVTWQLAARQRSSGDSAQICITASFENAADVVCCMKVYIPSSDPILDCSLSAPTIIADNANLRYTPMPFSLTLTASNSGVTRSDSVWATIDVPVHLDLAGPDAPGSYTKLLHPAIIEPLQTAGTSWRLLHPRSDVEKSYTVTVWLHTANADPSKCEIDITIPPLPVTTFPITLTRNGPLRFCAGGNVEIDVGTGYASYHWSNGWREQLLTATESGDYYCIVEHSDGRIGISDTLSVTVVPPPAPRLVITGSLPMCVNDTVRLDAGSGYTSYLWSTGSTAQTITVRKAGAYHVRVRDGDNCVGYSDTVLVTTKLTPYKPTISRMFDWLTASGDVGAYYWYRDGVLLPDSGSIHLRITGPGRYQVRNQFLNGCSAISDPFVITVQSAGTVPPIAEHPLLSVWPEPASDIIQIAITGADNQSVTVALYDILGRSEVIHSGVLPDGGSTFTCSVRGRIPGVYYLVALLRETVLVKRVTIYD